VIAVAGRDREAGDPLEAFIDDVPGRFDHATLVLFDFNHRAVRGGRAHDVTANSMRCHGHAFGQHDLFEQYDWRWHVRHQQSERHKHHWND
jgi:hypothetical protein